MGFSVFGSFLVLSILFRHSLSQESNTDGSFIHDFLKKMSVKSSSSGYNFSAPFCSWRGVYCDKGDNVIKLVFSGLGLVGVVPDTTIGKLSHLEYLDLSNNKITALPSDLWSLNSLKYLNLSFNQITGSLPSNIGNFGRLESLDLSENRLSGSLPEAIDSLTSLQILKLKKSGFESSIPFGLLQCHSLVSLDLSENKLSGSLPNGFAAAFPKLMFLSLAENGITGSDLDLSGMRYLSHLNISGNMFKGSVVSFFQGAIEVLDLSNNQMEGDVSQVKFDSNFNWSHLVHLDLSQNKLSGELYGDIKLAQNIKFLNVAQNRFSQQQFPEISMMHGLEYLNLSDANLIGNVSSGLSMLSSLKILDLSRNHISGHIPPFSIKSLQILDVSYNNFTGEIPQLVLRKLPWMEKYNFSFNNLTFCASNITHESAFIGALSSCPIAANPAFFHRKAAKHRSIEFALVLTISMVFLLIGLFTLLFLAFGCRRKTRMWEVKPSSQKEEPNISGPFSFQTDSTTWTADVKQVTSVPVVIFEKPLLNFTFADLLSATSHFDRGTFLAEGRFGPVYRGYFPGGIHVAVKVLVHGSTLTDQEAAKELEYLGRIKHPNLVPLTGYCLAGEQQIAIYDYMENGNLQNLLHDLPLGVQATDDWSTDTWEEENNGIQSVGSEGLLTTWTFRHKILLGTARALAFLHHGCSPAIIHRDVKASSVYLDMNLEPRLSDFGLSKIFGNSLEDEFARGSPGYVPPEYLQSQSGSSDPPTPKSDVYAFGVILFELITGKKPVGDDYHANKEATLVTWVRDLVRKNEASRAIDPKIRGTGEEAKIKEAMKIGYLCTAELSSKRPTMQQVVGLLKDIEPHSPQ
ncbi:hypothetical protein Leryth_001341 [Lithospermum erythrorhizon]|nr:hypothetical protein Leryth_001341 [Lithospermum erythrorhizon]